MGAGEGMNGCKGADKRDFVNGETVYAVPDA
jgi:hypothetical protein